MEIFEVKTLTDTESTRRRTKPFRRAMMGAGFGAAVMVVPISSQAASGVTFTGFFNTESPQSTYGEYTMPNPEGNFDKACARGNNGSDTSVKVGLPVPVLNGNQKIIGTGVIESASFRSTNGSKGYCTYYFKARNLPRSNFYCARINNEVLYKTEGSKIKNGAVQLPIVDTYLGPNWPRTLGSASDYAKADAERLLCRTN